MVTLFNMTVGELIKSAQKKRGISQIQLSHLSNISTSQISRIINGERGASIDTLLVIADVLGIRREEMLRAAAGVTTPQTNDEWVEEQNRKLNLVPAQSRSFFEKMLDSLIEEKPQSAPTTKKARSKA